MPPARQGNSTEGIKLMNDPDTTQGQPQVGITDLFAVDGPWSQMAKVLECPRAKTVEEVIEEGKWLIESYRRMCNRLQDAVQKHKLGLGGEKIDILVCEALDAALSANASDQ